MSYFATVPSPYGQPAYPGQPTYPGTMPLGSGMPLGSSMPYGSSAPIGIGTMPPMPPPPLLGAGPMPPPGSMPPGAMPMPSMGGMPPPGARPPPQRLPPPEVMAQMAAQLKERLPADDERYKQILATLNAIIPGGYQDPSVNYASKKARVDKVDWRVPRLMWCKDPKWNLFMDPRVAPNVAQKKLADGNRLEDQLAAESWENWSAILHEVAREPPPEEIIRRPGIPFTEAQPMYRREEDIWERDLVLRTLEEAMRGDVSKPLPRPVLFPEDYENYRAGKYIKDDCLIA